MTIKDIARMSGVSISTVSRVLNNRPDVSPEVRRRVLAVVEDHNYIPNNSARDLVRTGRIRWAWWYGARPTCSLRRY